MTVVVVPPEAAGERLDRWLASQLDEARNQVQRWIKDGRVTVDGKTAKPSLELLGGEEIATDPPDRAADETLEPEAGDLSLLHADDEIIVVDKPAGLTVHPGAGRRTGTLVHRLLDRFPDLAGVGGTGRPGIVHRLDKDTSGVLVVARTHKSHRVLARAFAGREVEKRYLAVVYGLPTPAEAIIDRPIGRHHQRRKEMTVRSDGRPSLTSYRVLSSGGVDQRGEGFSLLEVAIATGRTHQIRVHLKDIGHSIVGDPLYGEARWKGLESPARRVFERFPRPALHAWRLGFDHPATGERVAFEAPVPEDFAALWRKASGGEGLPLPSGDGGDSGADRA